MNHQTAGKGAATRLTPDDLSALHADLREQRRFRLEQLRRLDADTAERGGDAVPPTATSAPHTGVLPATTAPPPTTEPPPPAKQAPPVPVGDPPTAPAPAAAPPADRSAAARDEVRRKLAASARMVLADVEAALARMAEGRYGTCLRCGHPLPRERLVIVPQARYCAYCQQAGEVGR